MAENKLELKNKIRDTLQDLNKHIAMLKCDEDNNELELSLYLQWRESILEIQTICIDRNRF